MEGYDRNQRRDTHRIFRRGVKDLKDNMPKARGKPPTVVQKGTRPPRPDESLTKAEDEKLAKEGLRRVSIARVDGKEVVQMNFVVTRAGASESEIFTDADRLSMSTFYAGMPPSYAWYRKDSLVRRCINLRANWATKAGFDTVVEPVEEMPKEKWEAFLKDYVGLKEFIDQCNRRVQLDKRLKHILIRKRRDGKAVYQIVWTGKEKATADLPIGEPRKLIPLRSDKVEPLHNDEWDFIGIRYKGQGTKQKPKYAPQDLIYLANDDSDEDLVGLSDIEPILPTLYTRDKIRNEDLPEAVTTLWAPTAVWRINRDSLPEGMDDTAVGDLLKAHVAALKPGKNIATTTQFEEPTIVDVRPDLTKMIEAKRETDREVIQNFEVPRFLVAREEDVNRATADTVVKSFVDGPVSDDQKELKREVEAQWYDRLTEIWLKRNSKLKENEAAKVRVVHQWRALTVTDWLDLMKAITEAYADGMGWISQKKAYEIMQRGTSTPFDLKELEGSPFPR